MANPFAHADRILSLKSGTIVMACKPIQGVNMGAGGAFDYAPGARFRVKFSSGNLLWCIDEAGRSITLDREAIASLEAASSQKSPTA